MNTKKIAESIRKLANRYQVRDTSRANQSYVTLMEIANELDPIEKPKPLLADAQVGWICERRDGKYVQVAFPKDVCNTQYPILCSDTYSRTIEGYYMIGSETSQYDIIHTEPLAAEGSAEWAWQMMLLSNMVIPIINPQTPWKLIGNRAESEISGASHTRENWIRVASDRVWQLYEEPEPKPKPEYEVGDWVELSDGIQCCLSECLNQDSGHWLAKKADGNERTAWEKNSITLIIRKLDRSEVVVKIGCLKGTIKQSSDPAAFILMPICKDGELRVPSIIAKDMLDSTTRELVQGLLRAQEKK